MIFLMRREDGRIIGFPGLLSFHVITSWDRKIAAMNQNSVARTEALYETFAIGEVSEETKLDIENSTARFKKAPGSIEMEVLGKKLLNIQVFPQRQ